MKLWYLLSAALASFIVGLLAHAPASSLYGWMVARGELPVRLYGISGSLLSGSASQLMHGSQVIARDLHWRFRPLALLGGRLGYHLRTEGAPLLLEGDVDLSLGKSLRLQDLRASGELRALAALAGQTFIPINGQLGVQLDTLRIDGRIPHRAEGHLQLIGLAWTLGREPLPLGDFEALIDTTTDGIVASVATLAGVVDVDGAATLSPEGLYSLDLQLLAEADAPPMVTNLLRSLGAADARGYHRLTQRGSIGVPVPADAPAQAVPATPPPLADHPMMPPQ
ncbi:MAG: type II secretion system protein N [Sinimarinibacterium flocculans]|uniref:type II secretion system protein N n=1 Tax=Sinimarinibacterium flocculans TaxID=985250 RepID=UPI003C4AE1DD